MQRLEVSGAVRLIYVSLGVKRFVICLLTETTCIFLTFVTPCVVRTTIQATNKTHQIPFIDLFIDLYESALHVSGDKLAHLQEHFLTVYTASGTMHRYCCRPVIRSAAVQCTDIAQKAVYTVKKL